MACNVSFDKMFFKAVVAGIAIIRSVGQRSGPLGHKVLILGIIVKCTMCYVSLPLVLYIVLVIGALHVVLMYFIM